MVKDRVTAFPILDYFMFSLQPHLTALLGSLPPSPIDQGKLNELVIHTLETSKGKSSSENCKAAWEYLLKNDIFKLAVRDCIPFICIQRCICYVAGNGRYRFEERRI
jgi:hypothetical protein